MHTAHAHYADRRTQLIHTVHHGAKGTDSPKAQPQAPANEPCDGALLKFFFLCLPGRSQLEQHFLPWRVIQNLEDSEEVGP